MALLEMQDICKSFSGVYANDHISLSVEKGERIGLIGANGTGKSEWLDGFYTARNNLTVRE